MELKFTDENFEKEVMQSDLLVIVDFYAEWCGPCKMMAPIIEEMAEEFEGIVKIGKLNTDENPETSAKYRVMSIPTILFIKNGEVKDTIVGAASKAKLVKLIDDYK